MTSIDRAWMGLVCLFLLWPISAVAAPLQTRSSREAPPKPRKEGEQKADDKRGKKKGKKKFRKKKSKKKDKKKPKCYWGIVTREYRIKTCISSPRRSSRGRYWIYEPDKGRVVKGHLWGLSYSRSTRRMTGYWRDVYGTGKIHFLFSRGELSFSGTWGKESSDHDGGFWSGSKRSK